VSATGCHTPLQVIVGFGVGLLVGVAVFAHLRRPSAFFSTA